MQQQKKVNLTFQILSTIFIPLGIYSFHRIGKMRMGIIIYVMSFIIGFIVGIIGVFVSSVSHILYVGGALASIVLPMIFMLDWTIKYNSKV